VLTPPRQVITLTGSPEETFTRAQAVVINLASEAVLWHDGGSAAAALGASYDAVVLNLHEELDPDVLAQLAGTIWGGGALILRVNAGLAPPTNHAERLLVSPYVARDVTTHLWDRLCRGLLLPRTHQPVQPPRHTTSGSVEQADLVEALVSQLDASTPMLMSLTAPRGRGKSAALGLVLKRYAGRVAVTGPTSAATQTLCAFWGEAETASIDDLLGVVRDLDLIVVDEAAQIPLPQLQQLVRTYPAASIIFSTTVDGYEGTGRGYHLKFLLWLDSQARPLLRYALSTPIRWRDEDPLEALVTQALLLDARPSPVGAEQQETVEHQVVARGSLSEDHLRQSFGLLLGAHYRTTPTDLHRLLDAPNLTLHLLLMGSTVVAVTLVAEEGLLNDEAITQMSLGGARLRGHALAENLICHAGEPDAGHLSMIRSVRIATHPDMRRRGLASTLVKKVHDHHQANLFGTTFGATADVLRFRRSVGYGLVRMGAVLGRRTGAPSVVMVRPVSDTAKALVGRLQAKAARDLPYQIALLRAEGGHDEALCAALLCDLPAASTLPLREYQTQIRGFLMGPVPLEACVHSLRRFVEENRAAFEGLCDPERAAVQARLYDGASWRETAVAGGYATVRAAHRGVKRALQACAPTPSRVD
jgi:tRNA(Met) cytidine acetyltransferase